MGIHLLSVEEKIQKLIEPESISAILLTHSHWDHIDDIEKYEKANCIGACKVCCRKRHSNNKKQNR